MVKEYKDDGLQDDLYDDAFDVMRQQEWFEQVVKERRNEQGEYPTPNRQETV